MARSKLSLTSWTTCAEKKGRPGLEGKRETDQAIMMVRLARKAMKGQRSSSEIATILFVDVGGGFEVGNERKQSKYSTWQLSLGRLTEML